jgi:RND family efflux transporter MFP subunit
MQIRIRVALIGALALVVAVGGAAFALRGGAAKPAMKKDERPPLEFSQRDIVSLANRKLSVEMTLTGSVQPMSQATVRSKLSAEVRRVVVREGDRVSAGQVLVELDTAALKVQFAERTATLESARAQLLQFERTRQAQAQLVKQSFISQNAFDTADASYRAQVAAVDAAQAQLAQTQLLLADAVVRAPIDGHVSKRHVQPGEKVSFDAPLLAIVDLSQLEIAAQAPVSDVSKLAKGAAADIDVEGLAGKTYRGRVERINPGTEPGTRMINVYVALGNEDGSLRAGMFARVRLAVGGEREVAALPLSAIQKDGELPIVWVIAEEKLVRKPVALGVRDERAQMVEIVSGLAPEDKVIATKFDNLRDGLAAKVISGAPSEQKVAQQPATQRAN